MHSLKDQMFSLAVLLKSTNTIVLEQSVHNGTKQHNCVFTVQPKVQPIAPNKKLYVHTGSLKAHHCEGFIKLHKIDPLCPKG
jgi:hypothetical protein